MTDNVLKFPHKSKSAPVPMAPITYGVDLEDARIALERLGDAIRADRERADREIEALRTSREQTEHNTEILNAIADRADATLDALRSRRVAGWIKLAVLLVVAIVIARFF